MFADAGVSAGQVQCVAQAIAAVLDLAGTALTVPIRRLENWRTKKWQDRDGLLLPYQSLSWYLAQGARESRDGQLNVQPLMLHMAVEPWQEKEPHYDVVLLSTDIYEGDCHFVLGSTMPGFVTVISTHRFFTDSTLAFDRWPWRLLETLVTHEVGHLFGLPNQDRQERTLTESLGIHCTNRGCVMRQGLDVPDDWVKMYQDTLRGEGMYCPTCLSELRNYFKGK